MAKLKPGLLYDEMAKASREAMAHVLSHYDDETLTTFLVWHPYRDGIRDAAKLEAQKRGLPIP